MWGRCHSAPGAKCTERFSRPVGGTAARCSQGCRADRRAVLQQSGGAEDTVIDVSDHPLLADDVVRDVPSCGVRCGGGTPLCVAVEHQVFGMLTEPSRKRVGAGWAVSAKKDVQVRAGNIGYEATVFVPPGFADQELKAGRLPAGEPERFVRGVGNGEVDVMTGFAGKPGTAVDPTWWISSASSPSAKRIQPCNIAKSVVQSGPVPLSRCWTGDVLQPPKD